MAKTAKKAAKKPAAKTAAKPAAKKPANPAAKKVAGKPSPSKQQPTVVEFVVPLAATRRCHPSLLPVAVACCCSLSL